MEGVTKVADDIYFSEHPTRPGWFCGITVVAGRKDLGLVDTGFENTPEEFLVPFLEEIGREPGEISAVYNTHGSRISPR